LTEAARLVLDDNTSRLVPLKLDSCIHGAPHHPEPVTGYHPESIAGYHPESIAGQKARKLFFLEQFFALKMPLKICVICVICGLKRFSGLSGLGIAE
jgi:hypothetical protein